MTVTRISRSFKDISLSFDAHPVTKDLTVLRNANAIKKSVRNLVQTIPTERFFNSILGSRVRDSLFDFVDHGTASNIAKEIKLTLRNFEPRIDGVKVEVIPRPNRNEFECTVFFDIVGEDIPTQEFTFMLEATR
jgi:hypothetical protein|tara:strand:- start:57 stop:458 length:402 start_codon:yes stop_codon:yes gene_type:complete